MHMMFLSRVKADLQLTMAQSGVCWILERERERAKVVTQVDESLNKDFRCQDTRSVDFSHFCLYCPARFQILIKYKKVTEENKEI